jgi:hypothetical protein
MSIEMTNKITNGKTKKGKFVSTKQGRYTVSYIEDLRLKVRDTCNFLQPKRLFDFDTSKQSTAYTELDNLLHKYKYPPFSSGTHHNFFTKSPKTDKNGNYYFSFQERTIEIFEDFVDKFYPSITKEQQSFIATVENIQENGLDNVIKRILHNTYTRFNGKVDGIEVIEANEDGSATVIVTEKLEAITDITHVMADYRVFNKGKVNFLHAINLNTEKQLHIYTNFKQEDYHGFFIVFDEVVKSGSIIEYKYVVQIENFFADLLANRMNHTDRRPGVFLKYNSLKEIYIFPDKKVFERLVVIIKRHPNPDLIEKIIQPLFQDGKRVYTIEHGDLTHFNVEISVHFKHESVS